MYSKESPDTPGGLEDLGDRAGLEALGSPECLGGSEGPGVMSKPSQNPEIFLTCKVTVIREVQNIHMPLIFMLRLLILILELCLARKGATS